MKIIYFNNPLNPVESEIASSLKKYDLKSFNIANFDIKEMLKECEDADLFLFHGTVIADNDINYLMMIERLKVILMNIKCKKVMWFFEKVWGTRAQIVDALLPLLDKAFFVDETWVRRTKEPNIFPLHPAQLGLKGEEKEELKADIIYVGKMYGTRTEEFSFLKETFGERVKFYDDKYGQDLADLCASAKIAVVPMFPFDDFYWSDRVYEYMSNGVMVVHPRTQGLTDEGFEDGKHYYSYNNNNELATILIEMLENDKLRKEIAKNGKEFVKKITYKNRIKELIK